MKEIIEKILNEYIVAKQEPFEKHPIGTFFRKEIPQAIYATGVVDPKKYQVKGSVGQGNWAEVPWICIFDRNITTTSTKGIYIAYLLARDGNTLYLTLDQGCTNLRKTHSNKEVVQIMRQKARDIISKVNARGFRTDEGINLGAVSPDLGYFYQKGTIFYKAYRKGEIFSEEEIRDDLARMMQIYADYVESEKKSMMVTGNFDSWEICSSTIAIKQCDKSFFDYNGSGIPKEICWFFKADRLQRGESKTVHLLFEEKMYSGRISKESAGSGRVRIFWDTDLGKQFEAHRKKKIAAKFTKINEDTYRVEFTGSEEKMPIATKEVIAHIKTYISASGFSYPDGLVENFFLSLKSKPFVILAGTSGTGKTRLVKLFADAIGAVYQLVPVRPDWADSSDLFGHLDLNGKFIPGTILKFLKSAQDHPKMPYFLCLDEMNLARVEYYLSDILSVIETRELVNGEIVSVPLITIDQYAKDAEAAHTYGELRFPQNLYLVGTVNMDETTFPFSRKVLDRANTIEFNHVDLMPDFKAVGKIPEKLQLVNSFLRSDYLLMEQCFSEREYVQGICTKLQQINEILQKENAHIGYRVRDEIIFYMLNNKQEGHLLKDNEALDNEIMQKILPRIQGSSAGVRDMLCELFRICAADHNQRTGDSDAEKMKKVLDDTSVDCRYRKSAEKLAMMVKRFEEDGFTSYWL